MSYQHLSGLETYLGMSQNRDEVYVLRLRVTGAPITTVGQALKFAAATGRAFAGGYLAGIGTMPYDVRGILLSGQGADWVVDVVCTFAGETGPFTPNYFRSAQDLSAAIMVDAGLRQEFPSLAIDVPGAAWFYMDGDDMAGEIAYWLSAPMVYDHTLKGSGSTTQAYDNGQGVWIGQDGRRTTEWKAAAPPPIGPYVPPADKEEGGSSTIIWVALGAAAVGYLVWRDLAKRPIRSRL